MTPATTFAGREVALFGLGGSGLATALALKAGGARVHACDDNPAKMQQAREKGIETLDLREADWSRVSALVLSPGVPLTHPEPHWSANRAKAAGIEIIGDIELFCREREKLAPSAPFVAITGTNGKSTTTALIAHILREAGRDVQMGGNIGTAILSLEPPTEGRIHVIEMSSFQIDLTPSLRPTIGVLLNVSPDHLDRHGTMENYAAIKERLVAAAEHVVIGVDDPWTQAIAGRSVHRRMTSISTLSDTPSVPGDHPAAEVVVQQGRIVHRAGEFEDAGRAVAGKNRVSHEIADLHGIGSLRGDHNAQNAAAATAALLVLGVGASTIASGLRSFAGLPHRMEEVGRYAGALFINDSKATNADSTEKALLSFDHIHWILGGKPKEGGIASLRPYFSKIETAYLIGAATEEFAQTLEGQVRYVRAGTLERAVELAAENVLASQARPPVVLLSPACASYDQFPNYEVRGNRFRELVQALPGIQMTKGA